MGLNQLGKVGVSIGISIIFFWSAEIYPTVIRNSLFGVTSMFGRLGSITAPFIADLVRNSGFTDRLHTIGLTESTANLIIEYFWNFPFPSDWFQMSKMVFD